MHFSFKRMLPSYVKLLQAKARRPWTHDRDTVSLSPHDSSLSSQRPDVLALLCSFANLPLSRAFPGGFYGAGCLELLIHNSHCQVVSPVSKKSCHQFPFFLVSPAVTFKHTNRFLWAGEGCEAAGCAEPSFARELFVLPVSGIKSLLIYPGATSACDVPALPIGDSDTRWQQWPLDPALGEDVANVSLHPSFSEDSFPLYFPPAHSAPARAIKIKLHRVSTGCSYLVCQSDTLRPT